MNCQVNKKKLVIADDEEYIRRHLAKKLAAMGLDVYQAGTGQEVLALAADAPDLIVMDVKMPGMDGLETTRHLKENVHTQHIPVVLLSAMAQPDEVSRGLDAGAVEYVMKPVTFNRLLQTIRSHLDE
ncbi:MAG: response regulator [Spirochaetales bacterium]|nr:response regulator [Spirochaetales bacterium]